MTVPRREGSLSFRVHLATQFPTVSALAVVLVARPPSVSSFTMSLIWLIRGCERCGERVWC